MARKSVAEDISVGDFSDFDSGTYWLPEIGLVVNGVLVDSPEKAAQVGFGRVAETVGEVDSVESPAAEQPVEPVVDSPVEVPVEPVTLSDSADSSEA